MQKNDYYVYLHIRKDNGIVFYVGKGRKDRARKTGSCRSQDWHETVKESGGFNVEFAEEYLTNTDAINLENYLLTYPPHNWRLVNKRGAQCAADYEGVDFSRYFYYDETSPTGLRWLVSNKATRKSHQRSNGDVAGTIYNPRHDLRSCVRLLGKFYYVHRIIWKLFNPSVKMQELVVNHIDNDPSNNTISNLELVTPHENSQRAKMMTKGVVKSNNTSGINGVRESGKMSTNGSMLYSAIVQWVDTDGARKFKSFPYKKHGGKEAAFKLAVDFRNSVIVK